MDTGNRPGWRRPAAIPPPTTDRGMVVVLPAEQFDALMRDVDAHTLERLAGRPRRYRRDETGPCVCGHAVHCPLHDGEPS